MTDMPEISERKRLVINFNTIHSKPLNSLPEDMKDLLKYKDLKKETKYYKYNLKFSL
jgi:hypothetical protein